MSIIIDLVLVAILALCIWNGYRKGLILGIAGLLVLIVAFVGANLIAKTYAYEFMPIVEPFLGGVVDSAVVNAEGSDEVKAAEADENVSEDEKTYITGVESLKNMGIFEKTAKSIIDSLKETTEDLGKELKSSLTEKLSKTVCFLIVFIIAFLLIVIVFTIIANIINLVFKLPGLELINNVGGIIMGAAKGLLFVFVLAMVMQYAGFAFKKADAINKTVLLKWIMKINPLPVLFGL